MIEEKNTVEESKLEEPKLEESTVKTAEPKKEMTVDEVAAATGATEVDPDGWEKVDSDMGKTIRWTETAKDDKEAEKTIYIGPEVAGLYTGKRENIGENNATIYQIKNLEQGALGVWDTTVLRDKMKRIWEGNEIRIVCKGTQKPLSGGKAYFLFDVYQRPASKEFLELLGEKPVDDNVDPDFV